MVYFRLSTSGLTTGPPSSYTQPQSGRKPRHQAEQGSASLDAVSVSQGVVSEVQNWGGLFSEQFINFSFTGTVWYIRTVTESKSYVCILFLVLWKMSLKFISRRWVQGKKVSWEMSFTHSVIQRASWSLSSAVWEAPLKTVSTSGDSVDAGQYTLGIQMSWLVRPKVSCRWTPQYNFLLGYEEQ